MRRLLLSPLPTKTNYDIGYQFIIPGSSFNNSWCSGTPTSPYNIITINWNGSGNYQIGLWEVEILITINISTTGPPSTVICWNTASATSTTFTKTSSCCNTVGIFQGVDGRQPHRFTFYLNVTNITTTYYLNYWLVGGAINVENIANSQIQFTRIA
jgi:hypothetical protein